MYLAFELHIKCCCSFDTDLSVPREAATQLDSNFEGDFNRGGSLFTCWVMLSGSLLLQQESAPSFSHVRNGPHFFSGSVTDTQRRICNKLRGHLAKI